MVDNSRQELLQAFFHISFADIFSFKGEKAQMDFWNCKELMYFSQVFSKCCHVFVINTHAPIKACMHLFYCCFIFSVLFHRAYRIGQCRDVTVFRLISLGTVEEIIYLRQIYKQVH